MSARTRPPNRETQRPTFDAQPTLVGELVELRPLEDGDFHDLFAVASDPLIWEQHPVRDRWTPEGFATYFRELVASGGALLAIDVEIGAVIGSSRFHGFDEARREVEIGWTFLARSHWGGAYNGEMKRLMLRHALQFVDRVILLVSLGNLRSQRAVEKIGGVRVGTSLDAGGRPSVKYEVRSAP